MRAVLSSQEGDDITVFILHTGDQRIPLAAKSSLTRWR